MKKIKTLLSTLVVLAIVGGVLAFKVKNSQNFCFYTKVTPAGACALFAKVCEEDQLTTVAEVGGDLNTIRILPNCSDPCPVLSSNSCDRSLTLAVGD